MKIYVLASGSSGNCTYLELNKQRFLIDAGISCRKIENKLKQKQIDPKTIDYVLITHTHLDHIQGLEQFAKKYQPKIFLGNLTNQKNFFKNTEPYQLEIQLKDIKINIINTSHDSEESYGFIFEYNGKSLVYLTDTGYINQKIKQKIKNKSIYILESNHDVEMLMATTRPHHLKMRILGDKGHLSNEDCINCLANVIGDETEKIMLVHLSEEANHPSKVLQTTKKLKKQLPIYIIGKEGSELIEL